MKDKVIAYLKARQVCEDLYIIIPDLRDKVLKGGIVRADENKAEEKEQAGEIVAVGPGRISESGVREPMEFKVGQKVLFKKYAGDDYFLDSDLERYPAHTDPRDDIVPVKVLRQSSILHDV